MRKVLIGVFAIVVFLVAALVAIALGGGDDEPAVVVPSVLADVCSQNKATVSPDLIEITEPLPGAAVSSPLKVKGSINAFGGTFYISLVTADGTHIIDYPGRTNEPDTLVPFEQQVPFSYFEQAPACVWIYRENIDGVESMRIPVVIQPVTSPTNGGQ